MSMSSVKGAFEKLTPVQQRRLKMVLGAALGGTLGLGYYSLIGCATGVCPLTSNPIITTGIGAWMGVMMMPS